MNLINIKLTFEDFWNVYPRKQDKKRSEQLFDKLSDTDKFNAVQGAGYQVQNNPQWKNPTMVPLPTTFISQQRWNDEVAEDIDAKTRAVQNHGSHATRGWALLVGLWGQSFITKFGETPPPMWRAMLDHLSEERIVRAIKRLKQEGSDFPCSLPHFAECAAKTFEETHPFPALPHVVTGKEKSLEHLAVIRKQLRSK